MSRLRTGMLQSLKSLQKNKLFDSFWFVAKTFDGKMVAAI